MADMRELKEVIGEIATNTLNNSKPSRIVLAKLKSLAPLQFDVVDSPIELRDQFLVTPKYRVFREEEIGREFVFLADAGGQVYFYLYERAPQGQNGVPYDWSGEISGAKLIGTCPDGQVIVTHGSLGTVTHDKGGGAE